MTLRIHAPNPMRVGETANVLVTSDNPGVVSLTYGAGLTGPASVVILGTRTWRNRLKQGQYLAREGASSANRFDVSFCVEVNKNDFDGENNSIGPSGQSVFGNMRRDYFNRDNYRFYYSPYLFSFRFQYLESAISSNNTTFRGALFDIAQDSLANPFRFVVELTQSDLKVNTYHTDTFGTPKTSLARLAGASGTVGGNEVFFIAKGIKVAKYERLLTEQERSDYVIGNTLPASALLSIQGGHEILESAPVFWDSAGTKDLTNSMSIQGWPAAAASGDFTDDPLNPVIPYAIVPVTAVATTGTTIDATRPRQGVPARASEAERIETATQCTVTVEAPLVSIGPDTDATVEAYPADLYLQVCAQPDGVVSLASDDANLTVPATVEVSGGSATVTCTASADVTGATVTATYGDTTDTASVTVTEAAAPAETLVIGPDVTVSVDAYPAVIKLLVTSNTDGEVTVESDDANIIPDSPVNVVSGEAQMDCLVIADVTGATLTASRLSGVSDTCTVTTTEAVATIKIGPSQTVRRGSTIVSVHITGEDGTVSLTSTPHGLDCPATATISSGEVDISIPIMSAGTYTITATDDTGSDTAVVVVPGNYQATEDYDLVQDIADVIEDMIPAAGNAYHYDEIVIDDDGRLDAEDHVFGVRVIGTIEGPIVGGKTIMAEVAVASFPQVSPAEVEALQNYLSQEADWPAYVGAVVCNQVQVNALNGGDIVIYQLEVILG